MESILKSEVFFFISSVSVIIITILLIIVLFRLIGILNDIKKAIKNIEVQVSNVKEDFISFKNKIVTSSIVTSLLKLFLSKSRNRNKKK